MSFDQVPTPVDATDKGNYAPTGPNLQIDAAQAAPNKADNGDKSVALVQSGVLPNMMLHENEHERQWHRGEGDRGQGERGQRDRGQGDRREEGQRHEDGRGGKDGQHHGEGMHHGRGMHHGFGRPGAMVEERLHRSEFKKLSPEDREKFKAEDGAAREYHKEMSAWKKSGKTGAEPTKPDIPEHDALAAKVKADREAITKSVRSTMTPEELAAIDQARTQYRQQIETAGSRKGLPMPTELHDYDKRIAGATREYLKGQS
jgi:hypothetical protein